MINQNHSNNNLLLSVFYWCVGQINYIISTVTVLPFMDVLFKVLSIISILMVIAINMSKFIDALKGFIQYVREWFKK